MWSFHRLSFLFLLALPPSWAREITRSSKDGILKSYICPLLSRHVEVWDELPESFRARHAGKVRDQLPSGCTIEEMPSAGPLLEEPVRHDGPSFLQISSHVAGEGLRLQHTRSPKSAINTQRHGRLLGGYRPALVPYPKSVSLLNTSSGTFRLSKDVDIRLGQGVSEESPYVKVALHNLRKRLGDAAAQLPAGAESTRSFISLGMTEKEGEDPDSYKLTVQKGQILLEANGPEGFSHGVTTLQQLIPLAAALNTSSFAEVSGHDGADAAALPAMVIEDAPAFKWRGLHLDVSRHFFPAEDVKKLLTTMAAYKLNRFHWHLTDDQGWRFPVNGYPELTRKGAGPRYKGNSLMSQGEGIEGSYTEDEIADVLAYAKARHIKVIPEVDVPGHVAAAVASYPELGNKGFDPPAGPQHEWGVHKWTLAPTKKSADFLETVFSEIARLFPDSEYIHFGGDEAPQDQWHHSSADARKDWEHFEGPNAQSYFNKKVSDIIRSHGKKMGGWDEVQSMASLPKDAAIFAWRSENELKKALHNGRTAVNAMNGKLYLDHPQGPASSEPKSFPAPATTARDVYEYDALPSWVSDSQKHLVLGAQGQLWSEYLPNWHQVEYMAWPRAIALAERVWTPKQELNYVDFSRRLSHRLDDLKFWGVHYHPFQAV